jgi:hypothetical protein
MEINWNDVQHAISDVQLEILITVSALGILFLMGILIGVIAAWFNHRATPLHPIKPVPVEQPKQKLSIEHKMPLTTEIWLQQRRSKIIAEPTPATKSQPTKQPSKWWGWWANLLQGMSTEFFGAVVTAIFLGVLILITQQYQSIQNRKEELILQMGSDERVWAIEAARQLSSLGWLEDGTLIDADLEYANLSGADLAGANLSDIYLLGANLSDIYLLGANLTGANLWHANLTDANLSEANLTDADLVGVNLTGADLWHANLTDTSLEYANLTDTSLEYANLTDTYLMGANFTGSNLTNVVFGAGTVLPRANWLIDENSHQAFDEDGNYMFTPESYWTPETDMTRYTDPNHPDYWNPCVELERVPWYCED